MSDFGLMYYNARWYDPYLNRMSQPDTIVPGAGNSQAWDRYSYVNNSPLNYTDPSGHQAVEDEGSFGGCKDSYLCYISPERRESLRARGRKPSYGDGLIGPPDLRGSPNIIPQAQCTSDHPCLGPSQIVLQNPTLPDYYSFDLVIVNGAVSVTIDRYGNVYLAPGASFGSSVISGGSGALVQGWVEDPFDSSVPSEEQMEQFLQGPAITASGGVIGGVGATWSPWAMSSGDAFASDRFSYERGIYTPQIGITATWGFMIWDHR